MMRFWFRDLARKCLSGHQLHSPCRAARPRPVRLRLEAIEDRIVAATLTAESPALLPESGFYTPTPQVVETRPEAPIAAESPVGTGVQIPLEVPKVEALPAEFGGTPTPGTNPEPLTHSPDTLSVKPPLQAPTTQGALPALDVDRTESIVARRGPSEEAAPPDKLPDRRSSDAPSDRAPSGEGRPTAERSPGGTAGETSHSAPAAPTSTATGGVASAVGRTGSTDGPGGAVEPNADRVAQRVNRLAPRSHPPVPGGSAVPNADGVRLPAELSDGSLLHRYVANREQAAFTALVQRHEQFVLGVCRRVLGDSHAAQDAFQATFLVLARKASMLDRQTPLGGWLYRVAYHVALRLRTVAARQRRSETEAAAGRAWPGTGDDPPDVEQQEIRQAVREELQQLPEKYRTPLVLCYVDGRTHADVAREIGVPRGSMAKRIGEGLDRLRERLSDRGFML